MNVRRQKGLTLIGFFIVLSVVLFFIYAGMRLAPSYLEYHALTNAMNSLRDDPAAKSMSPVRIKQKIMDHLWVSYSNNNIKREHMRISKKSGGINVRVAYEVRKPFLGNVDVILSFDRTVVLR
jgi:hypothetical protein